MCEYKPLKMNERAAHYLCLDLWLFWMDHIADVHLCLSVSFRQSLSGTTLTFEGEEGTVGQIREKHRTNSHPIIHFPTSEGVSEVGERANE